MFFSSYSEWVLFLLCRQYGHVVFQLLELGEVLMHLEGSFLALIFVSVPTKVAFAVILCGCASCRHKLGLTYCGMYRGTHLINFHGYYLT